MILKVGRSDEVETIPTVVSQEGDGYRRKPSGRGADEGRQLTNEDLQRSRIHEVRDVGRPLTYHDRALFLLSLNLRAWYPRPS